MSWKDRVRDALPDAKIGSPADRFTEKPRKSTDKSVRTPEIENWKSFPIEAFPPVVAEFVSKGAESLKCDPSYFALPAIGAMAGAIGAVRTVSPKPDWFEPCIAWVALIAESGTAKTPAFRRSMSPLDKLQNAAFKAFKEEHEEHERRMVSHEARFNLWKKKPVGEAPEKPPQPVCNRILVSDATVESLAPIMEENPRGLLLSRDELAGFLSFNAYKKDAGADVANWLSTWSAGPWTVDRRTQRRVTHIERTIISVAGTIPPPVARECLSSLRLVDGTAARILMACPPRQTKEWSDIVIPGPVESAYGDLLLTLRGLQWDDEEQQKPLALTLTSAARSRFIEWDNEHCRKVSATTGALAASLSKLEAYCLRLSLVIKLATDPDATQIDTPAIEAGIVLADWFAGEARRAHSLFSETPETKDRRELIELIQRKGYRITVRELQRARSLRHSFEAEAMLEDLIGDKLGKWEVQPTKTKPATAFHLFNGEAG